MSELRTFLSLITGSFSTPAGENPTVAMIEAAYAHHQINARYLNCEVAPQGLADAVRGARAMGWAGFNCSILDIDFSTTYRADLPRMRFGSTQTVVLSPAIRWLKNKLEAPEHSDTTLNELLKCALNWLFWSTLPWSQNRIPDPGMMREDYSGLRSPR
jgi:hypothetical protein